MLHKDCCAVALLSTTFLYATHKIHPPGLPELSSIVIKLSYFLLIFRIDSVLFHELCEKLTLIEKKNTVIRDAITVHDRLCVTLRLLASGCSYQDLMYSFRITVSSISKIIPEVCEALYNLLRNEYLQTPSSNQHWEQIGEEFESKWQFPHEVGAINGKLINMRAPPNSGPEYFNYTKQFSIFLLAVANANVKFISFDLGPPGSQSDGEVGCNWPHPNQKYPIHLQVQMLHFLQAIQGRPGRLTQRIVIRSLPLLCVHSSHSFHTSITLVFYTSCIIIFPLLFLISRSW